ncbi:putative bifunctional diguanylate cyclase/phosphodiesterase [Pseudoalteromonas galatheae]|uniref:putative bifunctional diguanylate cyclase/phosphodiesterase n=1 Tax=Pseudoalteromonas galatheae TaxID=579562 RepID=UPI001109833B|nr:EAL domain-containing protein [Pseudoalteromonas galatheae]
MSRLKRRIFTSARLTKARVLFKRAFPALWLLLLFATLIYVGVIVNVYYQNQSDSKRAQELTRLEYLLDGKLQHVAHLLYSIDAYLNTHQDADFYEIAQSQLTTANLGLSMETYAAVSPDQFSILEKVQRERGYFDFKVRREVEEQAEQWLVVTRAAPVSEVGQTVGQARVLAQDIFAERDENDLTTYVWPDRQKLSVLIEQPRLGELKTLLGLSFELPMLLDSLFGQLYQQRKQHILVSSKNEIIYSSDWQKRFDLNSLTPSAVHTINFYGLSITMQLYDEACLHPSWLNNHSVLIVLFLAILAACILLVWLQLRQLKNRNETVNSLVIERTKSLEVSNHRLQIESNKRLGALQQQVAAERKYKSLFFNSHEGLFVLNRHGHIIDSNPAFNQLLFAGRIPSPDTNFAVLMQDPECHEQWNQIVAMKRAHQEMEWLAKAESGEHIWLRHSGNWLHQPDSCLYEGRVTDITQAKLFQEQLHYKAQHDSLTDLLNRQSFVPLVDKLRERRNAKFTLLYIDLDRFKLINDTLGHQSGDKLLIEFATRMRTLLSSFADIARLGGDEFAVLIYDEHLPQPIEGVLEDILARIRAPFLYQGNSHSVSGSVGVRHFTVPCLNYDAEKLLHDADIAMYEAKKRGKNTYHVFTNAIACEAGRKIQIEQALQAMVMSRELNLNLQPVYCQQGQNLKGFEALLRWNSPTLGEVSPAEFIPIAEQCAKISELGRWVFDQALSFMNEVGDSMLFIAVNVSPLQLQSPEFAAWLMSRCKDEGIAMEQIKLELTESAMMAEENMLIGPLEQLHQAGFGIYIDDFGTGYSSLARLNHLPVDGVKIDRAFMSGIEQGGKATQLIEAICAIANSFNLVVTAEGIETAAQLDALSRLYCHQTQGYFMSKPLGVANAKRLARGKAEVHQLFG